ncbi:hypothetical protein FACS1894133_4130 [Clostridia bacterium]|nr:hypothetical protein FACS1894133_4130 [Clostridia bacterium]
MADDAIATTEPRRRGRPRKNPLPETAVAAAKTDAPVATEPRRRGRPKKQAPPVTVAKAVKTEAPASTEPRRRGRPKKQVADTPVSKVQIAAKTAAEVDDKPDLSSTPHFRQVPPRNIQVFDEADIDDDEDLDFGELLEAISEEYPLRIFVKLVSELAKRCETLEELIGVVDECVNLGE